MLSSACLCSACVGGFKRVGSKIARGGAGVSIMQMKQLSNSMGLEWTVIHTCAFNTTTSSTGFILFIFERMVNPHTFTYCALYIRLCIFLLCRLKINHMRELWMCFFSWDSQHRCKQFHLGDVISLRYRDSGDVLFQGTLCPDDILSPWRSPSIFCAGNFLSMYCLSLLS